MPEASGTRSSSRGGAAWIAAGFGSGWLPKAPGTWGSLFSLVPAVPVAVYGGAIGVAFGALVWLVAGCIVCAQLLQDAEKRDPAWIVIDEWAGQWLAYAAALMFLDPGSALIGAFLAFRAFDIWKPWPIGWLERRGPAWWSIMADDLAAALYAGAACWIVREGLWLVRSL